jgi:hypothetical protein
MTQLEDQLRLAFRAKASEITPPPPPLELQPRPVLDPAARGGSGRAGTPLQRRWLVPLAAAVAVLAVVAGALSIGHAVAGHRTTPTAPIQRNVPRYYVALVAGHTPWRYANNFDPALSTVATVRDTATGSVIARVTAPAPYLGFSMVSGAADDRTFVLLAYGPPVKGPGQDQQLPGPERFYLLHINPSSSPGTGRAQLTALPANDIPAGTEITALALSPDGQALAAIVNNAQGGVLTVYYLQTGNTRTWTWMPDGSRAGSEITRSGFSQSAVVLSWTANGKSIGFAPSPWSTLWVLDIAKPGADVRLDSTPVDIRGVPVQTWTTVDLTPDGKSAFVSYLESFGQSNWIGLDRFSASTGQLAVINKLTVTNEGNATGFGIHANSIADTAADNVLWTSYDGNKFVVVSARPGNTAGIYSGNRYTPIPWPVNVIDAAW